jgi:hypothetical protein
LSNASANRRYIAIQHQLDVIIALQYMEKCEPKNRARRLGERADRERLGLSLARDGLRPAPEWIRLLKGFAFTGPFVGNFPLPLLVALSREPAQFYGDIESPDLSAT